MQNKYKLKSEIEAVKGLRLLAQAYEEIAVNKMQRVRSSVLSTREFLDKLSEVFTDIKSSYKREIARFLEKKKKVKSGGEVSLVRQGRISPALKNGKTLSIFVSSNAKLYGDIILKVFRLFMDDLKKDVTDVMIVGAYGKELFEAQKTGKQYAYFTLSDKNVTLEELKPIMEYIAPYEGVRVYYGKFLNVVMQEPVQTSVTGEEELAEKEAQEQGENQKEKKRTLFGFEPSLEHILNVFETQVLLSLFKQTLHESELSRLASRITSMEEALGNIDKRQKELGYIKRRFKQLIENKKQIETLSGISLWSR